MTRLREIVFVIFMVSLVLMTCHTFFNINDMVKLQNNTALNDVFAKNGLVYIIVGCIISLAQSASLIFDITLDSMVDWKAAVDDRWERFITFLLISIPSAAIVYFRESEILPVLFCFAHTVQIMGCVIVVLTICHQAYPSQFNSTVVLPISATWCAACLTVMIGFGQSMLHWANLVTYPMVLASAYMQYQAIKTWLKETGIIKKKFHFLSVREMYCFGYIASGLLVVGLVLIIGGLTLCNWTRFTLFDCLACVYTFCMFSIVAAAIPGRTARSVAVEEHKVAAWKRSLIRFLSHEIRSPLNVIQFSLETAIEDISALPQVDPETLEDFKDVQQSCTSAVALLDSMIQMEQIESGAFSVNLEPCSCDSLLSIAKHCGIITKQKRIRLTINNCLNEGDKSSPDQIRLLLDKLKFEQVIRNLLVNAVKFTPVGGSIIINVKRADPIFLSTLPSNVPQLAALYSSRHDNSDDTDARYDRNNDEYSAETAETDPLVHRYHSAGSCGIVVEVADSGIGISAEHSERVFGEFFQFKPGELQSGGGSGLGLWVCKNIVQLHGGTISCHSSGLGNGTVFRIVLRGYLLTDFSLQNYGASDFIPHSPDEVVSTAAPSIEVGSNESALLPRPFETALMTSTTALTTGTVLKYRILVVDDSHLNRKVVVKALHKIASWISTDLQTGGLKVPDVSSFEVALVQCEDGTDAVKEVARSLQEKEDFYNVILMDNIMTLLHGPEAASRMREIGFNGVIIGLTGNVMSDDVEHFTSCGADAVLRKPLNTKALKSMLVTMIHKEVGVHIKR